MGKRTRATGTIDARGRLVVPRAWREALDLAPGKAIVLETDGTDVRIVNADRERSATLARLRGSVPSSGSLVDELLADRRAEAAREADAEGRR